jgi:putative nucleotidyltransferase with HDIG domain
VSAELPRSPLADAPSARTLPREWFEAETFAVPMLPALAHRVIELAADPNVTVARLSGVVSKDQVLASRVLGLANSAYCAPMQSISTITEAIVRLGTAAVRNVVITVSFTSRMHDPGIYGPHGRALVDHAIGTAYLARLVAERARVPADEAFLCGLLHDIGKLVLLKQAFDHAKRSGHVVPAEEVARVIAERHAALGGVALRRWKLPETLDEPVMCHHDYTLAPARPREAAVTYLANRLAHHFGFGCPVDETPLIEDPVCAFLAIDAAWLADTERRAPGLIGVAREILT